MNAQRPTVVVLATDNAHKVVELSALLAALAAPVEVRPRPEWVGEVDETGATFAANADLKAVAVAGAVGEWALADDSGLEVDALGGAPGVRSARFAADLAAGGSVGDGSAEAALNPTDRPDSIDAANRRALSTQLAAAGGDDRPSARFRCALALADPEGVVRLRTEGLVEGRITREQRGDGGFGYDPMFVPDDGDGSTFAEMDRAAKAAISHRGRALRALVQHLDSSGWPGRL